MFSIKRPRERATEPAKGKASAGKSKRGPKRSRKTVASRPARRVLRFAAKWLAVLAIWCGIGLAGLLAWYASDLPSLDDAPGLVRAPNVTLLARDGSKIASFGGLFGEQVELAALPPDLPRAVMAIEDRRFYQHFGVDLRGLARAMWRNLVSGRIVQGGSTITQQLAKNLFLSSERSFKRKVQEALLAFKLERRFSKDEILTVYLNRVYLGGGAYGVDAAARLYFGKSARAATLYESALLAGLLKAPSRLNPLRNGDAADERTRLVLQAMEQAGYISARQRARALEAKSSGRASFAGQAPYFADWVMAQLSDYLGGITDDVQVRTTLDRHLQTVAQEALTTTLAEQGKARGVGQAALVSLDAGGAVRALVGGVDYGESQFNRATQALRQPGSAFKLFVFLAAFERLGLTADDMMLDAPVAIGDWRPGNYAGRYLGEVTLRDAFARSLNSVAVRLMQQLGPEAIAATARRLGITSDLTEDGSLALGTSEVTLLELTGAYGAIAGRGRGLWPHAILEVHSGSGELLYRRSPDAGPGRVASAAAVEELRDVMAATVEWGTGKAAAPGRPGGGKTGTSQDFRDALFIGYSGGLTTGVWFGNDDNSPMNKVTGGSLPAVLWSRVMAAADPVETPPAPSAKEVPADPSVAAADDEPSFITQVLGRLTGEPAEEHDAETAARLQRYFQPKLDKP